MPGGPIPPDTRSVDLVPLTPEARAALRGNQLTVAIFPFRIGRDSRGTRWTGAASVTERRRPGSTPNNDLYLPDHDEPLNVSREHLQIERAQSGFVLVDCKSTCGTLVEGELVGGQARGGSVVLRDGDVIIVGTSRSPFAFKFRLG
jgi:pSer/pThr/pTyr-binding forkhead associated (FHA) protein